MIRAYMKTVSYDHIFCHLVELERHEDGLWWVHVLRMNNKGNTTLWEDEEVKTLKGLPILQAKERGIKSIEIPDEVGFRAGGQHFYLPYIQHCYKFKEEDLQ